MSDLIERQAAINHILTQRWRRFYGLTIEDAMVTIICEVPTAGREWLHDLLQDAIDDGIITEVQAIGIMWRAQHKGAKD